MCVARPSGTYRILQPDFRRRAQRSTSSNHAGVKAASKPESASKASRLTRRAAAAAAAATRAGFQHAYSVVEGFEGDLDESRQRGNRNGWRFRALPWVQD